MNDIPTTYDQYLVKAFGWEGKTNAQYIRYQATSCGIDGGWLFVDEIVVQ